MSTAGTEAYHSQLRSSGFSLCQAVEILCGGLQEAADTTVPFLVEVPPVAWLASGCLGNSLPCTVEWLPAAPHDLLLVQLHSFCAAYEFVLLLACCMAATVWTITYRPMTDVVLCAAL